MERRHQKEKKETLERIENLISQDTWIEANEFLALRTRRYPRNRSYYSTERDFVGVYILHNLTKDKHYVGQATKVFSGVTRHLQGQGNGEIYADYKYGDQFKIAVMPIADSGYYSIDDLKRDTIERFDALTRGYNKNRV